MKVALIAPPWLKVPPERGGGIESMIDSLARQLSKLGVQVVLFSVGSSRTPVENRYLFADEALGPDEFRESSHLAFSIENARDVDLIHLHSDLAIPLSRHVSQPIVHTFHHPATPSLMEMAGGFRNIHYVAVSECQKHSIEEQLSSLSVSCISHGLELCRYPWQERKSDYFCYLGRIAPEKGVRQAIEACRRSGLRLKIAGPTSSQGYPGQQSDAYFRQVIEPLVDGKLVEYVGELGFEDKVDFLKHSRGLLFPVQWEEPFGLVVIEAMACGTPVLALGRGSLPELVAHGETGYIACDMDEFEKSIPRLRDIDPARCRRLVEERFSAERMADDYHKLYARILAAEAIQAMTPQALVSSHASGN